MYKKNETIYVYYVALKKTTGLTDLQLHVYNPNGEEIQGSPFTMSEIINVGGLYVGSFTPDVEGYWRIRITSETNGDDISKVYIVGKSKIDDVKLDTETIIGDIIDLSNLTNTIKTSTDTIKAKTDNLPDNTANELEIIKNKLDDIDMQVNLGGYIL